MPSVTVRLPAALVALFPASKAEVEVQASTVGEMIDALDANWPGMRDRLCDSSPKIRRNVNMFVEGRRARLDTPLAPGTVVTILPAVVG